MLPPGQEACTRCRGEGRSEAETRSGLSGKASQRKRNELRLQDGGNVGGGGEDRGGSGKGTKPAELGPGGGRAATLGEGHQPDLTLLPPGGSSQHLLGLALTLEGPEFWLWSNPSCPF